jgi:hypothetical protein
MPLPDTLKSPLSAVFSLLTVGTSKASTSIGSKQQSETEKLISPGAGALSEKADFRIEGMTCGACVEVRKLLLNSVYLFPEDGIRSNVAVTRPQSVSAIGGAHSLGGNGVPLGKHHCTTQVW